MPECVDMAVSGGLTERELGIEPFDFIVSELNAGNLPFGLIRDHVKIVFMAVEFQGGHAFLLELKKPCLFLRDRARRLHPRGSGGYLRKH